MEQKNLPLKEKPLIRSSLTNMENLIIFSNGEHHDTINLTKVRVVTSNYSMRFHKTMHKNMRQAGVDIIGILDEKHWLAQGVWQTGSQFGK